VILLDTHVWVWWVHGDSRLSTAAAAAIKAEEGSGLLVSVISVWEVAKLVEVGRLVLPKAVPEWVESALAYPGVILQAITPAIAVGSTQLPSPFHRDPADQILVATARGLDVPIVTADGLVLAYPHVRSIPA